MSKGTCGVRGVGIKNRLTRCGEADNATQAIVYESVRNLKSQAECQLGGKPVNVVREGEKPEAGGELEGLRDAGQHTMQIRGFRFVRIV
jgi:hypothetical protein